MTIDQFEKMTVRQKALYPFTDEEWGSLTKDQKKRVFFCRDKMKSVLEKYSGK
jgi:hypothetical protein